MPRAAALALIMAGLVLGGCVAPATMTASSGPAENPPVPTVIVLLDSGINPYHEAFDAQGAAWANFAPLDLGIAPLPLAAPPDVDARLASGAPLWDAEPGTLYAFPGTRVLAISFGTTDGAPMPIQDVSGHGTATASLVARDAPHAVIVMVQVRMRICNPPTGCLLDPSIVEAMEWAAAQPWIDVVSVSMSAIANAPSVPVAHPDRARYLAASRAAHDAGKLIVAAAGNDPTLALTDVFSGPPWVVAVGGANGTTRGEASLASRGVDVAANFTEAVAVADATHGTFVARGTSLGAPIVAATLAESLWQVRASPEAPQAIPRHALRDALNATALSWSGTEWTAPALPPGGARDVLDWHLPYVVAGPQGGWGYVHAGQAEAIAATALGGPTPAPGPVGHWQAAMQRAREAAWS